MQQDAVPTRASAGGSLSRQDDRTGSARPVRDAGGQAGELRGGLSPQELERWAGRLETAAPEEILAWALERFSGRLALACSFQAEDVVLVDMLHRLGGLDQVTVFYLETGLHFPETHATRQRVARRYGVEPVAVTPALTLEEQATRYGDRLWARDPDLCCRLRKVEPLWRFLQGFSAWITGIRREQTPARAGARVVEADRRFGLVKVNPLVRWKRDEVWAYVQHHGVPYNPLHDRGYPSIGCAPCTRPVAPGQDPRAGRWGGFQKTECGLHA
ncbi:MAG TPA: phosphoadenylyl-sulfate reductase [Thermaerobacter sp.]